MASDDPTTGKLRSQQDLEKSIKMLQRYGGLPETGTLDAATIKLMGESRCGVSDFGKTDNTRRKRRYTLQGTRWQKPVSYSSCYTATLSAFLASIPRIYCKLFKF